MEVQSEERLENRGLSCACAAILEACIASHRSASDVVDSGSARWEDGCKIVWGRSAGYERMYRCN